MHVCSERLLAGFDAVSGVPHARRLEGSADYLEFIRITMNYVGFPMRILVESESADSSGARACGTPDKASKPASNLSEPTCKAATRVEVSPAKPKPTTSPKPKPAASIERSSNRAMESNLQIKPSNRPSVRTRYLRERNGSFMAPERYEKPEALEDCDMHPF